MKKFFAFLKWHVSSWDLEHKLWMAGAACFGWGTPGYFKTGEMGESIVIAFVLWSILFMKWFVWDTAVRSWQRFEQDRKDLFKTIDEGK